MRRAVHLGAVVLAGFGVACTSTVNVVVDERKDLSGYRTWNFLSLRSGNVSAPHSDTRVLDASLSRLVERGLEERGFERVTGRPDFFVTYSLRVRRHYEMVAETPAMESLPSLHNSPSWEIQATETRLEVYENGVLTILVSDPDAKQVIWRGEFDGRFRGEISPHLEEAVSTLLERLSAPAARAAADP